MLELDAHLEYLNHTQLEAVHSLDTPVLVLAGAGTGKTRVIISRIVHIIKSQLAWPNEILTVTFTNKAAKEIHDRIAKLIDLPQPGKWCGTFHAIAAKILKFHCELLDLNSNFTIIDTDDQLKLIKTIMIERNLAFQQFNPKFILAIISSWKDYALTPVMVTDSDTKSQESRIVAKGIYQAYQDRLRANNLVDFGDLLLHNLKIFTTHPEILWQYQNRFKYILVDEYQDTNVAQYLWLRILAKGHNNICCVGDDDQSIYGWRGAKIENILRFEKDFPGAKIVRLEQNYRSSKYILQAASALIANNANRYGKILWTNDDGGHKLYVNTFYNDLEEAKYIAYQIQQKVPITYQSSKIAVLVRAGFQTRVIEEAFLAYSIAYTVIGNMKFYERKEIKDIIGYIRLSMNRNDDLAFERIINKPRRGVGNRALQKLKDCGLQNGCSLLNAINLLNIQAKLTGQLKTNLLEFANLINKWHELFVKSEHSLVVQTIITDSKYLRLLEAEKTSIDDATNRIENISELIKALEGFASIQDFLEHISLISTSNDTDSSNLVNIMTLHAAKGLEFDLIFLPGWEEGLFPNSKTLEESGDQGLEEERRLAYVGITRAKKEVHISSATSRYMYNQWQYNLPSRFLKELPAECCISNKIITVTQVQQIQKLTNFNYKSEPTTTKLLINQKVNHPKFGQGYVVKVDGNSADIFFKDQGMKKIVTSFLTKIEC